MFILQLEVGGLRIQTGDAILDLPQLQWLLSVFLSFWSQSIWRYWVFMYILILYSEDLLLLTDIFLASTVASMQRKTTLDLSNYFLYFLILFFVVYILFCIFNLFNLLSGQYNHLFFMEKEENKKIEIIPSSGINLERIISLHSLSPVLPETQADTTITVTNKSGKYVYVFSLCDE